MLGGPCVLIVACHFAISGLAAKAGAVLHWTYTHALKAATEDDGAVAFVLKTMLKQLIHRAMFPGTESSYTFLTFGDDLLMLDVPVNPAGTDNDGSYYRIPCLRVPCASGSQYIIIYSHSNGADIGDIHEKLECLSAALKCHILAFEYPRYGRSQYYAYHCKESPPPVTPVTEALVDSCLARVLRLALQEFHWPLENIILFGTSIGTGPCARLARQLCSGVSSQLHAVATVPERGKRSPSLGGLILQCPYLSIRHAAEAFVGPLISKMFVGHHWHIQEDLKKVTCPVLWVHGLQDELFDYKGTQQMFNDHPHPHKQMHLAQNATHLIFELKSDIIGPIRTFMRKFVEPNILTAPSIPYLLNLEGGRFQADPNSAMPIPLLNAHTERFAVTCDDIIREYAISCQPPSIGDLSVRKF